MPFFKWLRYAIRIDEVFEFLQLSGHVLAINLEKGRLSVEPIYQLHFYLPNTKSFANANLSATTLHTSIKKAEGGS